MFKWILAFGVLFAPNALQAAIINVNPGSANSLQTALDTAKNNADNENTIVIPAGIYRTVDQVDPYQPFTYIGNANKVITIQGAGVGQTFITSGPLGSNGLELLLDPIDVSGITVTGITFQDTDYGIHAHEGGLLTVEDCEFIDNERGLNAEAQTGQVNATNNYFSRNTNTALYLDFSSINNDVGTAVTGNIFENNQTTANSPLRISGGAFMNVDRNQFLNNTSSGSPGGAAEMFSGPDTVVRFTANTFINNKATNAGAVFVPSLRRVEMVDNLFFMNQALNANGGAANIFVPEGLFVNNTITGNFANGPGGGLWLGNTAESSLYNNIIFGNTVGGPAMGQGPDLYLNNSGAAVTLANNDIGVIFDACVEAGGCTAPRTETNNISEDPLFVDAANGDFNLGAGSPCIGTGDPDAPALPAVDIEGRPMNDPPDMGAYAAVISNILVNPLAINFGNISTEVPNTQTVTITNTGGGVLNVTSLELSDTANFAVAGGSCGGTTFSLNNAESCEAEVTFQPQAAGDLAATLTIASNDLNLPSVVVNLTGTGVDTGGDGGDGGCSLSKQSEAGRSQKQAYAFLALAFAAWVGLRLARPHRIRPE